MPNNVSTISPDYTILVTQAIYQNVGKCYLATCQELWLGKRAGLGMGVQGGAVPPSQSRLA